MSSTYLPDERPRSKRPMSNEVQPDPAPWFIKEIRIWGIGGFALVALGYFGLEVYKDQQARIEKLDTRLEQQSEKSTSAIQNNTAAMQDLKNAIQNK